VRNEIRNVATPKRKEQKRESMNVSSNPTTENAHEDGGHIVFFLR
jgi:hypothetical protein